VTGVLLVFVICVIVIVVLRDPAVDEPVPVRMARAAATTGRLGDVAVVVLASGNRGPLVTCSCADREVLFAGSLDDCRAFAHAYNSEVRRLWEGAISEDG